jgi:hypothetical protein
MDTTKKVEEKVEKKVEENNGVSSRLKKLDEQLKAFEDLYAYEFSSSPVQRSFTPLKGNAAFNTYLSEFSKGVISCCLARTRKN